jgi:hypothetical protein
MTKLIKCGCKADERGNKSGANYQDATYGEGIRVTNRANGKEGAFRCSVCGRDHTMK